MQDIRVDERSEVTRAGIVTAESDRAILVFEGVKFRNNMFGDPKIRVRDCATVYLEQLNFP